MLATLVYRKRVWFGLLSFLLCATSILTAQAPYVFDDEFSAGKLDTKKWDVQTYAGHNQGTFRADPDFYNPDAVSVSNHTLQILTERVPITDPKSGIVYPQSFRAAPVCGLPSGFGPRSDSRSMVKSMSSRATVVIRMWCRAHCTTGTMGRSNTRIVPGW